jgi:hypothetical protein
MPTIAYPSIGSSFKINGLKFDQVVTVAFDHTTKRIRGHALSSGRDLQKHLRTLRRGDVVRLSLKTPEIEEFENARASVVMIRTRAHVNNVLRIFFVFQLKAESRERFLKFLARLFTRREALRDCDVD